MYQYFIINAAALQMLWMLYLNFLLVQVAIDVDVPYKPCQALQYLA
jgi:hypothetical protein